MGSTSHSNHRLISSDDVQDTAVFAPDDKKIGTIDHLMIDKVSGKVLYAVMSFGGILGLGHSHHPIPWTALEYDPELPGYRTAITETQLKDAPEFSDDRWEDRGWEAKVHKHYGAPAYWEADTRRVA